MLANSFVLGNSSHLKTKKVGLLGICHAHLVFMYQGNFGRKICLLWSSLPSFVFITHCLVSFGFFLERLKQRYLPYLIRKCSQLFFFISITIWYWIFFIVFLSHWYGNFMSRETYRPHPIFPVHFFFTETEIISFMGLWSRVHRKFTE